MRGRRLLAIRIRELFGATGGVRLWRLAGPRITASRSSNVCMLVRDNNEGGDIR